MEDITVTITFEEYNELMNAKKLSTRQAAKQTKS